MMYLSSAFSLQMVASKSYHLAVEEITAADLSEVLKGRGFVSAIGHADTAAVISSLLGLPTPAARINVVLQAGDTLFVGQILGGRLPEGATRLPEGVKLSFLKVTLES